MVTNFGGTALFASASRIATNSSALDWARADCGAAQRRAKDAPLNRKDRKNGMAPPRVNSMIGMLVQIIEAKAVSRVGLSFLFLVLPSFASFKINQLVSGK
jgi:hypothetical protein